MHDKPKVVTFPRKGVLCYTGTMITSAIIWTVAALVGTIAGWLGLLGTPTLPSGLAAALSSAQQYYGLADTIFPIATLFQIIALLMAIEAAWWTYMLIRWGYQKIPGVN